MDTANLSNYISSTEMNLQTHSTQTSANGPNDGKSLYQTDFQVRNLKGRWKLIDMGSITIFVNWLFSEITLF